MIREFFTSSQNAPFVWALVVQVFLSTLVVAGSLLGAIEMPEADADLDVDWGEGSFLESALEFLGVAAMPLSVFILLGSSTFFVTGYVIQLLAHNSSGSFLPGWIAILPAVIATAFACRGVGKVFAKTKFKLHTTAIPSSSLVFRMATISQGTARSGLAAEAKLVDEHGQTHYVLVEPKDNDDFFEQGTEVVLVEHHGPKFLAVRASVEAILDQDHTETIKNNAN